MTTETLHDQAVARTHDLLQRAEAHYGIPMPQVAIRFDLRGKAAGMLVQRSGRPPLIRYNPILLRQNRQAFLAQTLPHEAAHLVARTLYGPGIRPHGEEWRAVMAFFGAPARRCHDFDTHQIQGRSLRLHAYACACGEHRLTSIRHNRILKGQRYLCRRCGETLRAVQGP